MLLRVSEFVYVSGGFSFRPGGTEFVDVRTGLTSLGSATGASSGVNSITTVRSLADEQALSEGEPGFEQLARSGDGDWIFNLPVRTVETSSRA